MKPELTRTEAYKRDAAGEFYADREPNGDFGVFGTESGFCYAIYSERETAETEAQHMNEER